MTSIAGLGPAIPPARIAGASPSSGFAVPEPPAPSTAATPDIGAAALLSLQQDEVGEAQDREARRHGHSLLAALAAVQRALLADAPGAEALDALAGLAAAAPAAADPRLRAVLDAISLRARVELARRGRD
jgi:hypothetical protein